MDRAITAITNNLAQLVSFLQSAYKSTMKLMLFDTVNLSIDCLFQDSSVH